MSDKLLRTDSFRMRKPPPSVIPEDARIHYSVFDLAEEAKLVEYLGSIANANGAVT